MSSKLTHQTLRTRLSPHTFYLPDILQRNLIFAKQAAMHNEISFESFLWEDVRWWLRPWWLCSAHQCCQWYFDNAIEICSKETNTTDLHAVNTWAKSWHRLSFALKNTCEYCIHTLYDCSPCLCLVSPSNPYALFISFASWLPRLIYMYLGYNPVPED